MYLFSIIVVDAPRIDVSPRVVTVNEGERASFLCRGSGDLIASLGWANIDPRRARESRGQLVFDEVRYVIVCFEH